MRSRRTFVILAFASLTFFAVPLLTFWIADEELGAIVGLVSLAIFVLTGVLIVAVSGLRARWEGTRPLILRTAELTAAYVVPAATLTAVSWAIFASNANQRLRAESLPLELSPTGGVIYALGILLSAFALWTFIVGVIYLFDRATRSRGDAR